VQLRTKRARMAAAVVRLATAARRCALAQIRALLRADDLASLIEVQRLSDTVVRLVPIGPLAGLTGLPSIPDLPIGLISLGT
jgi:hypothetical protein